MTKPKKIIQIPFLNGQMIRRPARYIPVNTGLTYIASYEFEDTIQFVKIGSTTSSNYAILKSKTTDKIYYMFMKDFEHMLKSQVLKLGMIRGKFTFVQRGVSFGIKVLSASKLEVLT